MAITGYSGLYFPASGWTEFTITLAALASDANLLAGRSSAVLDIAGLAQSPTDVFVAARFKAGTTPTAAKRIQLWAYGEAGANAVYPDTLLGTNAAVTLTSIEVKNAGLVPLATPLTDGTTGRVYDAAGLGIKRRFGGALPSKLGVFVTHDMGAAFDVTEADSYVSYYLQYGSLADSAPA